VGVTSKNIGIFMLLQYLRQVKMQSVVSIIAGESADFYVKK
jgi:hypothetical protein